MADEKKAVLPKLRYNFTEAGYVAGSSRWGIKRLIRAGKLKVSILPGERDQKVTAWELERLIKENEFAADQLKDRLDRRRK